MAPSNVCPICRAMLCPGSPDLWKDPDGWFSTPEQTLETFRDAALKNCVICSAAWDLAEKYRVSWSVDQPTDWAPLRYMAEQLGSREAVQWLNVQPSDQQGHTPVGLEFRLVAVDNHEYKSCFDIFDMDGSTSSKATLETARGWLQSCLATHQKCSQLADFFPQTLPTRLIDIGEDGDTHWILRILSEDHVPPSSSYVTLSYRWGSNPRLLLLSSNMAQLRQGSPIDDLPQTFRDVVTVARHLGVRYIWIDALCILQDSVEDWEAEAPTMRHVYANSACNIAASMSGNPEEAMFRPRDPDAIRPPVIMSSLFTDTPSPYYIFRNDYWDREILDGPLHKRGWVLQERFLAPRVLYFGKNQVLWECLSEHKCEAFPRGIPERWSDKRVDPLLDAISERSGEKQETTSRWVFSLWNDLIKQYTRCDLTRPSDKLVAVAGIAKLFQDITGDEYVAGWWKSNLLAHLDWRVYKPRSRPAVGYLAPSWSWASVAGFVRVSGTNALTQILVTLVDVQVTTREPDGLINILDAKLTLKAFTFMAICHYPDNDRCVLRSDRGNLTTRLCPDSLDTEFPEGKQICCIPYKMDYIQHPGYQQPKVTGIVAEEAGAHGDNHYRRLGLFFLDEEKITNLGSGEPELIVLV